MMNLHYEKTSLEQSPEETQGFASLGKRLAAIALFRTMTEQDIFGDQGGYPSIEEGCCFMHEGRRRIAEIHGDDFPQKLYQLEGSNTLEFEGA